IWAQHNGCGQGIRDITSEGNIRIRFPNCDDGVQVMHYGLVGQGHGLNPNSEGGLYERMFQFFRL
ncbi:MAG: hypothetical protein VX589_00485, partial [Myxococcota bacterium]|nr:hypothetical protein [Myxococcota bacterium]